MDRFTHSLSSRIVLVATSLLIVPLIGFILFMYLHEYAIKSRDAELILRAVASERTLLIEQELRVNKARLERVASGAISADAYPNIDICDATACRSLIEEAKPIGTDLYLVASGQKLVLLRALSDGTYARLDTDIPHIVEQVPGVPDVALYLLDEDRDVVSSSGGKEELPTPTGRIRVVRPIGLGGYRLLFDIPQTVSYGDFFVRMAVLSLLIIFGGGAAVFLLIRRISRPLRTLSHTMRRIGSGDLEARYEADRMGFELNELGESLNEMVISLKANIERQQELLVGQKVQRSLLPTSFPTGAALDIAARFVPARDVGGDLYDLYPLPDGRLLICMADGSGKGIFACLYALLLRSYLRSAAMLPLSDMVARVNDLLMCDTGESGAFVTAWIGLLDPATRGLEYINCGHNPALLLKGDGSIEELTTSGIALGVAPFDPEAATCTLLKGEMLVTYTDGIVEAHSPAGELYGIARLKETLSRGSSHAVADTVLAGALAFAADTPQHDDIALLVINF